MKIHEHIGHTLWCLGGIYINIFKLDFSAVEELWLFISIHFKFKGVCIYKPTWRDKKFWMPIPQQILGFLITALILYLIIKLFNHSFSSLM